MGLKIKKTEAFDKNFLDIKIGHRMGIQDKIFAYAVLISGNRCDGIVLELDTVV